MDGTSKNDNFLIERISGTTLIPFSARYQGVFASDGSVISQDGFSNGPLLQPAPQGNAGTARFIQGSYIHIHNGPNEIYIKDDGITGFEIHTGAGNDLVRVASNLKLPTTLIGGDGDDTLHGGLRSDSIDGGNGDDHISGGRVGSAKNFLTGGNGEDYILGSSLQDQVRHPDDGVVDHITYLISDPSDTQAIGSVAGSEDVFSLKNILRGTAAALP
jgi:Ca2+-binding RTX toxin-like protein